MDFDTFHFLSHAEVQMEDRGVSAEQVVRTVIEPDRLRIGRFGRFIAEKDFGARILRVVYNEGQDEYVIITVIPLRKRGGSR
jgi:Domain of unknown function (DUF4258)